jgi:hypothetical protein
MVSKIHTFSHRTLWDCPREILRTLLQALIPLSLLLERMVLRRMAFRWRRCLTTLLRRREIVPLPVSASISVTFGDFWINWTLQSAPCGPGCKLSTLLQPPPACQIDVDNTRSTIPKWPVRSVEALPAPKCQTLSNRILVIGNSVSSPLRSLESFSGLAMC